MKTIYLAGGCFWCIEYFFLSLKGVVSVASGYSGGQEKDVTYHDYTVIINVNSITNPIIRITTGEDGKLTNDIVGLMNVIITRK